VSKYVLPDGYLPLEAPLLRHPWSALRRRLLWATYVPVTVAGMLVLIGAISADPDRSWLVPLAFLPVTWALAVVAYFALGHTLVGPYLVLRSGALNRSTVALQSRAIIGWTLRETIFQRFSKRITVGVPTAAGSRHYQAPDAGMDQALAFIKGATPWLAEEFIEGGSASASCFGSTNAAH
jgi:putative membrane protein